VIDITRERDVAGTPEHVAKFIWDLERWPEWFALHEGWAGPAPTTAEEGARFRQRIKVLGIPGEMAWTVVEVDAPSRLVLKGKGTSRTGAEVDFQIKPANGGSQIAFTAKLSGLALRPLKGKLETWVEERADRTLDKLAELLAAENET
jgi:carbon monoxide dehydrogenase subunit G